MSARRAARRPRVILTVIDGMRPDALERAIAEDRAPALAHLMDNGVYVDDCVSAFPSVTPVCTASIATGAGPAEHRIPGMNWFHRGEGRYVEYGSSFAATRTFGVGRSLTDTIYNLNLAHLSRATPTLFERLDDADLRTAGTTFLIYRGRHRHLPRGESALARLVGATLFRHGVYGPRDLFYADLFASRRTGCRAQLGMPGERDAHAGCVGAHLVEHDLFDFLLLSLPDNDTHSHRRGPDDQVVSVELADRQLMRVMDAAGGPEPFLEEHMMVVLSDHAHSLVETPVSLREVFSDWRVLEPDDPLPEGAEVAICPSQRAAMVYLLDDERPVELLDDVVETAAAVDAVDLVLWREDDEGVVRRGAAELRFGPGGRVSDLRGGRWRLEGDLEVLRARTVAGRLVSDEYPDALARIWSALTCATAGDVLLSAAPGFEFTDWGGGGHLGGGSHGSLHREDSLSPLLWAGGGPPDRDARLQWTLRDVAPLVLDALGV